MNIDIVSFIIYGFVIAFVAVVMHFFAALLGPKKKVDDEKFTTYECGLPLLDVARKAVTARYYLVALMFVLFEIETLFLFPWALVYRKLGVPGLIEMFIFLFILALGLLYIWRKRIFTWGLKQNS